MLTYLSQGLGLADVALLVNRIALGFFFAVSGYHKLFVSARHMALVRTLQNDRVPFVRVNAWLVPFVEFAGGLAVFAGFYGPLFAVLLFTVCIVATCVDGLNRIRSYQPIDKADWLDDVLYLPEVLYCLMALVIVLAGPGPLALT
jgi:putative oxidoreductase